MKRKILGIGVLMLLLTLLRRAYMERLWLMFPTMRDAGMGLALAAGAALLLVVGALNVMAVRRRVMAIWKHRV